MRFLFGRAITRTGTLQVLLIALLLMSPATDGGTRPPLAMGGGGGVTPVPPLLHPQIPRFGTLVVTIDGPLSSYTAVVTTPSQGVVALGTTNAQGVVVLDVPVGSNLQLSVLGTDVVGLPVHAGQVISITIP